MDKKLYKTADAGRHWTLVATGGMDDRLKHGSVLNMDGSPPRLVTSADGGATWMQRYPTEGKP